MTFLQVHSLATTISLKMEIPGTAWKDDPHGIVLADHINHYLPETIRIFSILPIQRLFAFHSDYSSLKIYIESSLISESWLFILYIYIRYQKNIGICCL